MLIGSLAQMAIKINNEPLCASLAAGLSRCALDLCARCCCCLGDIFARENVFITISFADPEYVVVKRRGGSVYGFPRGNELASAPGNCELPRDSRGRCHFSCRALLSFYISRPRASHFYVLLFPSDFHTSINLMRMDKCWNKLLKVSDIYSSKK